MDANRDRTGRPLHGEIMDAWRHAARDLGIRVEIPFTLKMENGDVEFYEGHVLEFGGPKGTVFGIIDLDKNTTKSRTENGYFASDLSLSYRRYDRQFFIDTLDDWKWFGPEGDQPSWYTGKNWS
jgi:hypothetical protein